MQQPEIFPPILTVEQATRLLQYKKTATVYEMIRKKVIPTFPPGAKRGKRIHRDTLLEIVAKGGQHERAD